MAIKLCYHIILWNHNDYMFCIHLYYSWLLVRMFCMLYKLMMSACTLLLSGVIRICDWWPWKNSLCLTNF